MRSSRRSCIAAIAEAKYSMHAPNRHEISNHKPTGNGGVCHRKNDSRVTAAKAEKFSITSTANTPPKSTITTSTIDNTVSSLHELCSSRVRIEDKPLLQAIFPHFGTFRVYTRQRDQSKLTPKSNSLILVSEW